MGAFQGIISHAMHWLWKVSASKYPRDLHYDIKHDDWCYILRSVHRLLHQRYTDDGFAWPELQGEGKGRIHCSSSSSSLSRSLSPPPVPPPPPMIILIVIVIVIVIVLLAIVSQPRLFGFFL